VSGGIEMVSKTKITDEERQVINRAKRTYYSNYRKNNPEKIKKINQTYWLKKAREAEEKLYE
jgi:hypothetical protein